MANFKSSLIYKSFKVHYIYGFIVEPFDDIKFSELRNRYSKTQECTTRDGWVSMYHNNLSNDIIQILDLKDEKNNTKDILELVLNIDENGIKNNNIEWPNANNKISSTISKSLTLSQEGSASITITLNFEEVEELNYFTTDILRALLLVPKTLHDKTNGEKPKFKPDLDPPKNVWIANDKEYIINGIIENWERYSRIFKIFINTLLTELPKEVPNWIPATSSLIKEKIRKTESYGIVFDYIENDNDPQIPYIVVEPVIPLDTYRKAFYRQSGQIYSRNILFNSLLAKIYISINHSYRRKYTNEISALLNRWLLPINSNFISNESPELSHLIKDDVFINQYMNSLLFISFSTIVTIIMTPKIPLNNLIQELKNLNRKDYDILDLPVKRSKVLNSKLTDSDKEIISLRLDYLLKPIEITKASVLKCVEISRLRWHHAIWINREIDDLIFDVYNNTQESKFLDYFDRLIRIEKIVGVYLESPDSFLWDATVGKRISGFLQKEGIEKIENELLKKIELLRRLVLDSLSTKVINA